MIVIIPNTKIIEVMQGVIDNYLKPKFIELGMNASGDWLNSVEPRAELNRGEIWGLDYTYYLANGRAGGNRPPIAPLVRWVGYKLGLTGKEATSAAFAIATKIAKEGTDYYPEGTDLIEVLQSKEVAGYINKNIGDYIRTEVGLLILRRTKEILN